MNIHLNKWGKAASILIIAFMTGNREKKKDWIMHIYFLSYHLWSFQFIVISEALPRHFSLYFKKHSMWGNSSHFICLTYKQTWAPLWFIYLQGRQGSNFSETNGILAASMSKWWLQNPVESKWLLGPKSFLKFRTQGNILFHSVTRQVVYWAGGLDTMEQGEHSIIPIKSLSDLSRCIIKASCTNEDSHMFHYLLQ